MDTSFLSSLLSRERSSILTPSRPCVVISKSTSSIVAGGSATSFIPASREPPDTVSSPPYPPFPLINVNQLSR
ncbi:hypothetical protein ALUC_50983A [Aspergillus luchuensis]|nr:hypothetical protein ALUC_50983A [Aspergillus luchuensis]